MDDDCYIIGDIDSFLDALESGKFEAEWHKQQERIQAALDEYSVKLVMPYIDGSED